MPTAILVDGAFFLARFESIYGSQNPDVTAQQLHKLCLEHLERLKVGKIGLYRIFFYDCEPLSKKAHNPVSGRAIDFSKTQQYKFRTTLHQELKKLRKVALRLGYLDETNNHWVIRPNKTKTLLKGDIAVDDLLESDVTYATRQKGVDMRIGLDIASLALKRLVSQIVLISGDSDFVPAAKLARREGIDFVLDPMWANIRPDLHEHIDGLQSTCRRPGNGFAALST